MFSTAARPHVLDHVEPEPDRPADHHEVVVRTRHVGRQDVDAMSSQRETKNGTLSFVDMTDEISAAMYSAGRWLQPRRAKSISA